MYPLTCKKPRTTLQSLFKQSNVDQIIVALGVCVRVGGLRELIESEVGPFALLLLHALALRPVVGLGVGQLGDGHRDVFLGQLLLLPRVVHDLQETTVDLELRQRSLACEGAL